MLSYMRSYPHEYVSRSPHSELEYAYSSVAYTEPGVTPAAVSSYVFALKMLPASSYM